MRDIYSIIGHRAEQYFFVIHPDGLQRGDWPNGTRWIDWLNCWFKAADIIHNEFYQDNLPETALYISNLLSTEYDSLKPEEQVLINESFIKIKISD